MPTYAYECHACGDRFERILKMPGRLTARCACGRRATRVIMPPAGIIFKGGGWSKDGYSKEGGG